MHPLLAHSLSSILAIILIFVFGGMLVTGTNRIAHHLHRRSFLVAFLLLGVLTSMSEISIAWNATVSLAPEVSIGNLVGASFVIFLLVIPLLAWFGGGIRLHNSLTKKNLLLALFVIGFPSLCIADGIITRVEGGCMVILYFILLVYTEKTSPSQTVSDTIKRITDTRKKIATDIAFVTICATVIFMSGKLLVTDALYFSASFNIPSSLIGLLLISLGTNVPELVIAMRAIQQKKKVVAFGDYMGSAACNTLILGLLVLVNGTVTIDRQEFWLIAVFLLMGLSLFYLFSSSKNDISRAEGAALCLVYVAFVAIEILSTRTSAF